MSATKVTSLRSKFVRLLLVVSSLMGIATIAIVVWMSAQASSNYFSAVQQHIQDGIISKGRVLTQNHALMLSSLALDNAFLDMQRLVERAVKDDQDLVYGIFVNSERMTLAKSRRGDPASLPDAKPSSPDKAAYLALGLREHELLVSSATVQRTVRMGADLLEVAVPVVSEEGERLGTIRYGLSTRRMHEALASAKQHASARLWRSVLWIVALVSFVTALGLVLSRAQAVRITKPIGVLTQAAESLAAGDRSVRVSIDSGDELSALGASFNHMVEELASSYVALEEMNRTLEHKVEARTAELALKNRDMRLVLDNVDQGFITLAPDGTMAGQSSAVVSEWFGGSEGQQAFWSYIGDISREFAVAFRLAWAQLDDGCMPLEVSLDQLPERLSSGERSWSFRYLPFYQEGQLEGVLLVIADVTERLAREREEAEQAELMQGFKKLMLDRIGFSNFLRETDTMIEQITAAGAEADLQALKRTLHTLKGNSGVMGLTVVARLCHTLETQLAEEARMTKRCVADLAARWAAIREHVSKLIGSSQRVIEIPEAEYAALVSRLSVTDGQSDLLHQLLTWQLEPATRPLFRLAEQAKSLGRRLGKGELDVRVSAQNVRLDGQVWAAFFAELIHVVRNAVDHGLETPGERTARSKPPQGALALSARREGDQLTFEVTDDGRGIDWQAIAARASALGLPHSSHAELLTALCTDGVTTHDAATEISGRGVGMAAFRQQVQAMHGELDVRSKLGVGTTWVVRFRLPLKVAAEHPAKGQCLAVG